LFKLRNGRFIENLLFAVTQNPVAADRQMPDMEYLYQEMKKKSVTLQLLWYEYKQANPDGYQNLGVI
jgi:transposase